MEVAEAPPSQDSSREVKEERRNKPVPFITQDLSVAAWLKYHNLTLIKWVKRPRKNVKFEFTFSSREEALKLMLLWINSDAAGYDMNVRELKKMLFNL